MIVRDASNVMVGVAALFVSPENTPNVADTQDFGAGYDAPWIHPGFSEEGLTLSSEADVNFHRVEEQSTPVYVSVNERTLTIAQTFSEATLDNLQLSMGAGDITTVGGVKSLRLSDDLDILAVGVEGKSIQGFWRRFYIPRMVSAGSVEIANRRSESKQAFAASFQSIANMEDIVIAERVAAAV